VPSTSSLAHHTLSVVAIRRAAQTPSPPPADRLDGHPPGRFAIFLPCCCFRSCLAAHGRAVIELSPPFPLLALPALPCRQNLAVPRLATASLLCKREGKGQDSRRRACCRALRCVLYALGRQRVRLSACHGCLQHPFPTSQLLGASRCSSSTSRKGTIIAEHCETEHRVINIARSSSVRRVHAGRCIE
jgi:hypothetical protein